MSDWIILFFKIRRANHSFVYMAEELSASSRLLAFGIGLGGSTELTDRVVHRGCSLSWGALSASLPLLVNRKQMVCSPVLEVRQLSLHRKVLWNSGEETRGLCVLFCFCFKLWLFVLALQWRLWKNSPKSNRGNEEQRHDLIKQWLPTTACVKWCERTNCKD